MNDGGLLVRSRQELAASALLVEGGFAAQAVSRSYYAAFYPAETALLILGETRSKHSGVITAFIRLVVHEGGLDAFAGQLLRSLFDRRGQADDSPDPVPEAEGGRAIEDATVVVDAVERWLGDRSGESARRRPGNRRGRGGRAGSRGAIRSHNESATRSFTAPRSVDQLSLRRQQKRRGVPEPGVARDASQSGRGRRRLRTGHARATRSPS